MLLRALDNQLTTVAISAALHIQAALKRADVMLVERSGPQVTLRDSRGPRRSGCHPGCAVLSASASLARGSRLSPGL